MYSQQEMEGARNCGPYKATKMVNTVLFHLSFSVTVLNGKTTAIFCRDWKVVTEISKIFMSYF